MFSLIEKTGFKPKENGTPSIKQLAPGGSLNEEIWGMKLNKDLKIQRLVQKATHAYLTDALLRAAVDKYAENFKDFELVGEEDRVAYLNKRLNQISLRSGEHWKTTISRIILEYFKTGNAFILKFRGGNDQPGTSLARRTLYKSKNFPIAMLYPISSDKLEPVLDSTNRFKGWKLTSLGRKNDETKLVLPKSIPIEGGHLLDLPTTGNASNRTTTIFSPGVDIVQLAYKKGASSNWGVGLTLVSIEDIALLRVVEQSTSIMIKKFSKPIIHHTVVRPPGPGAGIQGDIDQAYKLHRQAAPDGVIITGANHEIKTIGSESQAMRVEGYLRYYLDRCFAGLGVSQSLMGIGSMSMGAAEAANEMLMTKVRFCQSELAREIEFFILNELLWEGGYDPYNNEADRVSIEFLDIDEDRKIKLRTHAADLYQKNISDLDEVRRIGRMPKGLKEDGLFVNKIKKAEVDHQTKGQVAVNRAKPPSTAKNNREKFKEYILKYVPQSPEMIPEFFDELKFHFSPEKVDSLFGAVEALIGDDLAIVELLTQHFF